MRKWRRKGRTWSDRETKLLLQIWSEERIQNQRRGAVRNDNVFRTITEDLARQGFQRTVAFSFSWNASCDAAWSTPWTIVRNKGKAQSLPLPPSNFALMNAASPFVYLWGDIINQQECCCPCERNRGPSRSGFEPGSRCPCERGDSLFSTVSHCYNTNGQDRSMYTRLNNDLWPSIHCSSFSVVYSHVTAPTFKFNGKQR